MGNNVRTRMLKGMLDLVVLGIVHERPTHGYKIIEMIRKRYSVYLGASTIYPMLTFLEKKGYVKGEWVFPKSRKFGKISSKPCKVYVITEQGKAMLVNSQTELKLIVKPLMEVKA